MGHIFILNYLYDEEDTVPLFRVEKMKRWSSVLQNEWVWTYSQPDLPVKAPPLFLLHGWTGNENSLHPLVQQIPSYRWIFAPRGPIELASNSYGWLPREVLTFEGYLPVVKQLFDNMLQIGQLMNIPLEKIDLLGFSQGAALSGCLTLVHPQVFRRVALISGYLPSMQNAAITPDLQNTSILIAHGILDDLVPIEYADQAAEFFRSLRANVTLCKTKTRHKISVPCLDQINAFLNAD